MIRSVYVETHTEAREQPSLFDGQQPPLHDLIRYRIFLEFRENDTIVYSRLIYINSRPRDWHFKLRLREAIKKEINGDSAFKSTKWTVVESFKYSYELKDNAGILAWMGKRELMTLCGVI